MNSLELECIDVPGDTLKISLTETGCAQIEILLDTEWAGCVMSGLKDMKVIRDWLNMAIEKAEPSPEKVVLFEKEYDGESIVDMERDVIESLDGDFNKLVHKIPNMEESPDFWAGTFKAQVTWSPDSE